MTSCPDRTLITGGSGFIGTNLIDALRKDKGAVANFDIAPPRNPSHRDLWVPGDVLDRAALGQAMDNFRPELVIHLAARTDLHGRTLDDYPANTNGVRNLVEAVRSRSGIRRTLLASSLLVCRLGYIPKAADDFAPSTPYGESKVIGERIAREADPEGKALVLFRPTSIWGPWFGHPYRTFFQAVVDRRYVHPGRTIAHRSYGYVGNAVKQIQTLATAPSESLGRGPYYLADYDPVQIKAWADQISEQLGNPPALSVPLWLFQMAAKIGDALTIAGVSGLPMTSFRLKNMMTSAVYDTAPMFELCPSLPHSRSEAIRQTLAWLRSQSPA